MTVLSLERISKFFGGFLALYDVSLQVEAGERRAIVGPNGAGKTTLFNILDGQLKPSSGRILIGSEDVTRLRSHEMWRHGVTRTFQRNNLFLGLTVQRNVRLAVQARYDLGKRAISPCSRFPQLDQDVEQVLEKVRLTGHSGTVANDLAYGQQRQLELAIALAGRPRILLLDEPTAGMSPAETHDMIEMLQGLPREITILIIEHDMDVIFALSDRVTVLHLGKVLAEGSREEIERDPRVLEVYLGGRVN